MHFHHKKIIYFGHHKCESTWIHLILRKISQKLMLKLDYVHSPRQFNQDLSGYIQSNKIDMLTYANADTAYVRGLKEFRGFHVIRDIRDIAVSSYYSHLYSHDTSVWPALVERRKKLQQLNKADGLLMDMKNIQGGVFDRIAAWDYKHPDIFELKMEELTLHPLSHFKKIFAFLGIETELPGLGLENILSETSFKTLSQGRKPGEENIRHHYRKGIAGDWINHFDEVHKEFIKERYGNFLIEHGYEKDLDW